MSKKKGLVSSAIPDVDPLDISARLDELRGLQPGWLEGHGIPPSSCGLDWLNEAFDKYYPERVPPPYLYPMPEGGIRAEWSLEPLEISLDIDLATHSAVWHALDLTGGSETVCTFNLNDPNAWKALVAKIHSIAGDRL